MGLPGACSYSQCLQRHLLVVDSPQAGLPLIMIEPFSQLPAVKLDPFQTLHKSPIGDWAEQ